MDTNTPSRGCRPRKTSPICSPTTQNDPGVPAVPVGMTIGELGLKRKCHIMGEKERGNKAEESSVICMSGMALYSVERNGLQCITRN